MSGTSAASEQNQQAAGGGGGGGGVAAGGGGGGGITAAAGGIGGGGGGSGVPPPSVEAAAEGAVGGGTASSSAASLSAAALAQEDSDGLGALKGSSPGGSPYRGSPRGGPTLTRSMTLGPNASSMDRPSGLSRVFNPPKLERKHSSGDLHSRLKTRKILGVGETDNGDIHRSKISQVLGHNEHLYVKLPRGFWSAHVAMGVGVTLEAGLLLLTPGLASRLGLMPYADLDDHDDTTASRVAGAALAGLCVFVWSLLGTSDKHYARTMLLSMLTYQILSICVTAAAALTQQETVMVQEGEGGVEGAGAAAAAEGMLGNRLAVFVGLRTLMCLLCLAYFYSIAGYAPIRGQKPPTGFRQPSHLHKDQ